VFRKDGWASLGKKFFEIDDDETTGKPPVFFVFRQDNDGKIRKL